MASRYAMEAIDVLLRDISEAPYKYQPFGGKIMVLGGDFRQVLPVMKHDTGPGQVEACLQRSPLWPHFQILSLTENLRALPEEQEFAKWLLRVGNGTLPVDAQQNVTLDSSFVVSEPIADVVFPESFDFTNIHELASRIILSSRNDTTLAINEHVLNKLPGPSSEFLSIDTVEVEQGDHVSNYPTEFLHSLTPAGCPPHHLRLKRGAIVMLLRNLHVRGGLCNGTRLIVDDLSSPKYLSCLKLSRSEAPHRVLIPRIDLIPSDSIYPFKLRRRQFPIRLAFSMTINKAQGQTFSFVGLDLKLPVFSHGQLYVALSRCRQASGVKIEIDRYNPEKRQTKNIVMKSVLLH
jgi:hypothetical protein